MPSPASSDSDAIIQVTDAAIQKVHELMVEEDNLSLKLRVFVTGGGCSGFQYGVSFEEEIDPEEDIIINKPPITLLIDAMSLNYLKGASIDYKKDLQGEQFIITNNPNAKTTCGCGSSFSAE